jgi:hypothetical protein
LFYKAFIVLTEITISINNLKKALISQELFFSV